MKKEYISTFFTTWFILLILNQTFIFGCFAPYCLLAGLVPTGIVAFFVAPFFVGSDSTSDSVEKKSTLDKVVEKTENISNALETHNQELVMQSMMYLAKNLKIRLIQMKSFKMQN